MRYIQGHTSQRNNDKGPVKNAINKRRVSKMHCNEIRMCDRMPSTNNLIVLIG